MDIFARPVPRDRYSITGDYRQQWAEENLAHGVMHWGSDPEITRDFHYDRFFHNQQPDNFLEFVHQKPNWTFSAMVRVDVNDFHRPGSTPGWSSEIPMGGAFLFEEKLPQVRFDLHPTHVAGGVYQELSLSASQSRHWFYEGDETFTELDGFYRLSKTLSWKEGMGLQLFAGARWVEAMRSGVEGGNADGRYGPGLMGDIGFNWEARYSRKWSLQNRVWNIDGLKHVVKPYAQARHNPAGEEEGRFMPLGYVRDTNLPNWDLATRRDLLFAREQTLARIGLKNQVTTRRPDYGSRELVNWDVAADYFFCGAVGG